MVETLSLPEEKPALLLCDYAEVINGKLYIAGGCIDQIGKDVAVAVSVALIWTVPWERTNLKQNMQFLLVTGDGESFLNSDGEPVEVKGAMEVGRPAGVPPGSLLYSPVAFRLPPMTFPEGSYRWEFRVNGSLEAVVSFRAK